VAGRKGAFFEGPLSFFQISTLEISKSVRSFIDLRKGKEAYHIGSRMEKSPSYQPKFVLFGVGEELLLAEKAFQKWKADKFGLRIRKSSPL